MFGRLRSGVNCGEPPVVDNGKREMTGTRYMDRATYTCDTGYYREGADSHFVCSKRAVWEGEDVVCEGKSIHCRSCHCSQVLESSSGHMNGT